MLRDFEYDHNFFAIRPINDLVFHHQQTYKTNEDDSEQVNGH